MRYGFAVFSTEKGGLVRRTGTTFVFVVATSDIFLSKEEKKKVGDVMPNDWLIRPENELAEQDIVEHSEDFRSMLV